MTPPFPPWGVHGARSFGIEVEVASLMAAPNIFKVVRCAPALFAVTVAGTVVPAILNVSFLILLGFAKQYAEWLAASQPFVGWVIHTFPIIDKTPLYFQSDQELVQARPLLIPGLRNLLAFNWLIGGALYSAIPIAALIDFVYRREAISRAVTNLLNASGGKLVSLLVGNAFVWFGLVALSVFGQWRTTQQINLVGAFCFLSSCTLGLCGTATYFLMFIESKLSARGAEVKRSRSARSEAE
jgi:hypothetical protein